VNIVAAQVSRDSAGIRIVSYPLAALSPPTWSVESKPLLTLGGAAAFEPTEFTSIVAILRMDDGVLAIADGGSRQVRLFGPDGKFLRTLGGPGEGPTEFRRLRALGRRADTLYAFDADRGPRLFSVDGKSFRAVTLSARLPGYRLIDPIGVFGDGSFLFGTSPLQPQRFAPGIRPDSTALAWLDSRAAHATLVGTFPKQEVYDYPNVANGTVAFGATFRVVIFPSRFCTGWSRTYEIRCYAPQGRLQLIVRRQTNPIVVTPAHRAAWVANFRDAVRRAPKQGPAFDVDGWLAQLQFASTFPAFAQLLAAETGDIWVREYRASDDYVKGGMRTGIDPSPDTQVRWSIFAPDGHWRATALLPPRFYPLYVGRQLIAGVQRDEDDEESVAIYQLRRR
jgi:hypothetical protein